MSRSAPRDVASGYAVTIGGHHDAIDYWKRDRSASVSRNLALLFEHFVGFFANLPEANVQEVLKLGALDEHELARIRKHPEFDSFHLHSTLHMHVGEAYASYLIFGDPLVISPMGEDEENGYVGTPVDMARAVNTLIAYAEKRSIDLAEALDFEVKRRTSG